MTSEATARVMESVPEAASQVNAPQTDEELVTTEEEERPPQREDLLCTICHMPSCWR
jgi:hypothetical protein